MSKKLMNAMKKSLEFNQELFSQCNLKSIECWQNGDREASTYWNDRAYAILCENEKLEKDIRKLKESESNAIQN